MKTFLMMLIAMVLVSCNHYYKATLVESETDSEKAAAIERLNQEKKYLILRNGNRAFFIRTPAISNDKTSLIGILHNAGVDHRLHLKNGLDGNLQYNNNIPNQRHVLDEAHVYIKQDTRITTGPISLPLGMIQKLELLEKDKKRTSGSAVLGVTIGILGVSAIVVLLFLSLFMS